MSLDPLLLLLVLSIPAQDTRKIEIDVSDVSRSLMKEFAEKIKAARQTDEIVVESLENVSVKLLARSSTLTINAAHVVVSESVAERTSISLKTPPATIEEAQAIVKSVCALAEVDNAAFTDWQTTKAFRLGDAVKKSFRQGRLALTVEIRRSADDDKPWFVLVTLGTARSN